MSVSQNNTTKPLLSMQPEENKKTEAEPIRSTVFTVSLNVSIICLVALTWCLATQFSKTALTLDANHFNAPYFMMWFNTNFMLTCYPVFLVYEKIRSKNSIAAIFRNSQRIFGQKGLTPLNLFIYVLPFLILWIGANYTYVRALLLISPSVATSISACNAAIVYFLSLLLLRDRLVYMKLFSVLFAIGGVVVISLDSEFKTQWLGITLSFSSALFAAIYKVGFKRVMGNAQLGEVSLFMSCLGLLNLTLNSIPMLILALCHFETVDLSYAPWLPMLGAGLLSLSFNFLVNFGIALLHPLVISVGMLCGIPLNTTIDIIFRHVATTLFFLLGTALIIVSFVLIIFPYERFSKNKSDSSTTKANTDVESSSDN